MHTGAPVRPSAALDRVVRAGLGLVVAVLSWPADEDVRRHLASAGQPRLLIVDPNAVPPVVQDPLEDWLWAGSGPDEQEARVRSLLARAPGADRPEPYLDEDGLLHVGNVWVAIPVAQVAVMALLLARLGRVVRTESIIAACREAGASPNPPSVRSMLVRLGERIRPVGLELVTVRQRGVMLRRAA